MRWFCEAKLAGDCRSVEAEAFEYERDDVPLFIDGGFDLAAQPVARLGATFECRRREYYEKMCAGADVFEDQGLEVASRDAVVVEEDVVAVLGQILINGERPREVGAAVAEEDGFLDASHSSLRVHWEQYQRMDAGGEAGLFHTRLLC